VSIYYANVKAYLLDLRWSVYLFRFGRLHRIDSLDFDFTLFLPWSGLTLRRHPLDDRNSGRRLDVWCLRRRLWPRQYDLLRLGQELGRIVRGYRRTAVFFSLRPGEHVTSAAVRHVAAEDAGDEASGLRARHQLRRRRQCRATAAQWFRGCRTILIGLVAILIKSH